MSRLALAARGDMVYDASSALARRRVMSKRLQERMQARVDEALDRRGGPSPVVIVALPLGLLILVFAVLLGTGRLGSPGPSGQGTEFHRLQRGMTWEQVLEAAGQPVRCDPPDALETRSGTAVLDYRDVAGRTVRVFMIGRQVDRVEVGP